MDAAGPLPGGGGLRRVGAGPAVSGLPAAGPRQADAGPGPAAAAPGAGAAPLGPLQGEDAASHASASCASRAGGVFLLFLEGGEGGECELWTDRRVGGNRASVELSEPKDGARMACASLALRAAEGFAPKLGFWAARPGDFAKFDLGYGADMALSKS